MFDLGPATTAMSHLIECVRDDQLADPTPCDDWTVADLLAHIHQFVDVFTSTARKDPVSPPDHLVDNWRTTIPAALDAMAAAWRVESAWTGEVSIGGVAMPAADNAVVAAEELTVHGWDLARATGQDFRAQDTMIDRVEQFLTMFAPGTDADAFGEGPFGPREPVPADADRLDRAIAGAGRDPRWSGGRD
ncbi:TIGR03086 family metal-binding protein [Williamsia deligens]|uniref:TIGR03086 family metal-binding protein n=1 Tax=Williamsia deligens TaxID=321325 RepID=A0ABW3G5H4_9NOCA|nr:TIGR03086 family metal-binding protein [Williamsia deligens]MCP2193701.1 TIGR03086 family protein [Williamsia deligens]